MKLWSKAHSVFKILMLIHMTIYTGYPEYLNVKQCCQHDTQSTCLCSICLVSHHRLLLNFVKTANQNTGSINFALKCIKIEEDEPKLLINFSKTTRTLLWTCGETWDNRQSLFICSAPKLWNTLPCDHRCIEDLEK